VTTAPRRRRVLAILCAVLLGTGLLQLTALAVSGSWDKQRRPVLNVTQQGKVTGLYPGRATTVPVVVRNTSRKSVRLRSVTARPKAVGTCPASMLRTGTVRTKKVLRPRRSVTVRVPVQLLRAAPNACQGRTFRLALKATGKQLR